MRTPIVIMKYKEELDRLLSCPPSDAVPKDAIIFRIVHLPYQDRNFLPQALNDPKKMNRIDDDAIKCSNWGLSCYNSRENAQHQLNGFNPVMKKFIGTNIAEIVIAKSDGMLTYPSSSGHMDLFEAESAKLKDQIKAVG